MQLEEGIRGFVGEILGIRPGTREPGILIHLYGNLARLAQNYCKMRYVSNAAELLDFTNGLNRANSLSLFDDIGSSDASWIGRKRESELFITSLTHGRGLSFASQRRFLQTDHLCKSDRTGFRTNHAVASPKKACP